MAAPAVHAGTLTVSDLRGSPARRRKEGAVRSILFAAASLSVVISGLIVVTLVREAWQFLVEVELDRLFEIGWFPRRNAFDIRTLFVGTLITTTIAMLVATPLGLGAAIYLSEYAKPKVRRVLKPIIEILAGIPSVVIGVFIITFVAPELISRLFSSAPQFTLLGAGIGVGIMVIPIVASISEDAMRSVPNALREAAFGCGARKLTTTMRVVVPAAVSGLVAAMIVAVSRAIGETMVVAIAAGASGGSLFTTDPLRGGQTMTAAMASLAKGTDQVAGQGPAFQSLFFVGFLLFLITLGLNMIANRIVRRVRQRY
jgi:phosphate transport system permease protein